MSNVFDQLEVLPGKVYSGDSIQWKLDDYIADYPLADYSLQYEFRLEATGSTAIAAAVEDSGYYVFSMPENMDPGQWVWALIVTQTSTSRSVVLDGGRLVVEAKPNSASALTHAERMLSQIERELEARIPGSGSAHSEYAINGRSLKRLEVVELEAMRKRYQAEITAQRRSKNGQSAFKKTITRFV